ncbi:MAG: hypothetical protein KF745_04225 [Phycisphaeraceae bacterium]|nr:hypothetical protein [Phycisphaeraceae bacterium]
MIRSVILVASLFITSTGYAQWNPQAGQWGKTDSNDLRVMTWNVRDAMCSSNFKTEGTNNWTAVARIIAQMKPDVLLLQETGDNSGNGTGSGVDSIGNLQATAALLLRGGTDSFRGGAVTAYVQKYAAGYDLPYIYVSSSNDGFNRNVVLSRYPFKDLNGAGAPVISDFGVSASGYAPGGTGGIRGFACAQITLPPFVYKGDVVVGTSHLRSGSQSSDLAERLVASQNIAYFLDYYFNGAGTGNPNPAGTVNIPGQPARILNAWTPIIWGGDWNEDEQTNGRKGPAEWMTQAAVFGGTDGTDRDRSDSTYDDARDPFTNGRQTFNSGSSKYDYIAWQDSIATLRRASVFSSVNMFAAAATPPAAFAGWSGSVQTISGVASDHRPVVADFVLPAACPGDWDRSRTVDPADIAVYVNEWSSNLVSGGLSADLDGDGAVTPSDLAVFVNAWLASLSGC